MSKSSDSYTTQPFPRIRLPMVDGGRMGRKKHTIHGLAEIDITDARKALRDHRARTGNAISLTAFIIACVGRSLDKYKYMHAYRNWRNQIIVFDQVDINMLFEVTVDGKKTIRPYLIRAVNEKTAQDIHDEIRRFQSDHAASVEANFINYFVMLPGVVRSFFYWILFKNPSMMKKYMGTVSMTALGMFGSGGFWAIPVPNHTLQITLGGIAQKPGAINGRIEIRKYLSVTISIDHDLVDGAPAARFVQHLKDLIETGAQSLLKIEGKQD